MYHENITAVEASGSYFCWDSINRKDIPSKPEFCIDPESKTEWCSTVNKSKDDYPWLLVRLKNRKFKLSGYSVKAGCCSVEDICCCRLYTWSLEGSNDNKTWVTLHKDERNMELSYCKNKTFEVKQSQYFTFFRIIQYDAEPGCWKCIQLAKIEFYGDLDGSYSSFEEQDLDDEISIIGRVTHN